MRADGPNFGLSAPCETTGLDASGLIQASEQIFGGSGRDHGVQDLSSACNYSTVAVSNLLKGNNLNCKLFPSTAEPLHKGKSLRSGLLSGAGALELLYLTERDVGGV